MSLVRTSVLIIGMLILCIHGFSQTLDWSSSFTPAWADGALSRTANNVAPGVNVSVSVTNSQAGTFEDVGNITTPAVNTNNSRNNLYLVAGSNDALELDVDWTSKSGNIVVLFTFSRPVYNVLFRIGDIDKFNRNSTSYVDRVTVTGSNGATTVLPTISAVNTTNSYVIISGNTVYGNPTNNVGGNANTNSTDISTQQGTVVVQFGAKPVTQLRILYDNHTSAVANPVPQAIAIGNLNFTAPVNVSGTVWNDINNSANNTFNSIFSAGETGTNGGTGLYVNLVNSSGIVVNTATVAANGTYTVEAPQNTNALTLHLSTTQGVPGNAAPANTVMAGWTNTSPLQTAAFNTGTADITGRDFGIEQLPETATSIAPIQSNPGGFNTVAIAASAFQSGTNGNPNTADIGGTVTNMRITTFPTNTNALRVGTTTYTNGGACAPATTCVPWPAGGVTVAYTNGVGPAVPIAIDPVNGDVDVVISIAAIDNAGKADPTPGSVTLRLRTISLSGNVWNDGNGNRILNGTERVINGTNFGLGLITGAVLYVNLVDPSGRVLASAPVQFNGNYNFPSVPQSTANLALQINTVAGTVGQPKPALVLPAGWAVASENRNGQSGPATDVLDGEIILHSGTVAIAQQNFGLNRYPVADNKFFFILNPVFNALTSLSGLLGGAATLSGYDPEDGALGNASRVAITSLPDNGNELWYNNVQITRGRDGVSPPSVANPFEISNFTPSLLKFRTTGLNALQSQFRYAFYDASGLQGTPATYTLSWLNILPVKLTGFTAAVKQKNTLLAWTVESQINVNRYEIEYSPTGTGGYTRVGTVYAGNQSSGHYSFVHENPGVTSSLGYYRLKMIDNDASYQYSSVVHVRFATAVVSSVKPTLLKVGQLIEISTSGNAHDLFNIRLLDLNGHVLQDKTINGGGILKLETRHMNAGSYLVQIASHKQEYNQVFKVVIQ
ncbi:MAG TPA: hypothetical protein VD794_03085 [Flavisolibacter sp.]|nr:hypothetical protein [Flavisolibacter sp.]